MDFNSRGKVKEAILSFSDICLMDVCDFGFFDSIFYSDDRAFKKGIEVYIVCIVQQCSFLSKKNNSEFPKELLLSLCEYLKDLI